MDEAEEKVVVFRIGGQEFGTSIHEVREVIAAPRVTPLPKARAPVIGVFNLRGTIITAVDGEAALGLPGGSTEAKTRAIVVQTGGRLSGILVDAASQVLTLRPDDVRPPPRQGGPQGSTRGIVLDGERAIILLDIPRLLASPEEAPPETTRTGAEKE